MAEKTFSPVTPAQMANLRAKLAARNVAVPEGNTGQISAHGFFWSLVVDFVYDGIGRLDLTILKLPPMTSADDVWNQIQESLS